MPFSSNSVARQQCRIIVQWLTGNLRDVATEMLRAVAREAGFYAKTSAAGHLEHRGLSSKAPS